MDFRKRGQQTSDRCVPACNSNEVSSQYHPSDGFIRKEFTVPLGSLVSLHTVAMIIIPASHVNGITIIQPESLF
jgi:hypothetical protein